ncbi:MAG TPA: putative metal-dependent hydrolase [Gemmatimonadaceae bacterium]|nr:putative metal-dependent hydrolase [Gemmatimonadaceae bacterium]
MTTDLRYPIGRFQRSAQVTDTALAAAVDTIAAFPGAMRAAVAGLSASQLDTPYRPGGWTVRQVVHHVADSHMQAYTRCKLAFTEDEPTIRPYDESAWAELVDSTGPIDGSLGILDGLHGRWVPLLRSLTPSAAARTFRHPETGLWRLDEAVLHYAWHSAHHLAHVTGLRERSGWR